MRLDDATRQNTAQKGCVCLYGMEEKE